MRYIRSIIFGLNIIVVFFTILSYIAPYVNPSKLWFFSFFGLGFPYFLILNLLFVFYYLIYDKKKSLLSIIVILAGYQYVGKIISFNGKNISTTNNKPISVMSYNVNQGSYLFKHKIKKWELSRFINKQASDILLLQEKNSKRINEEMKKISGFPHRYILGNKGVAILSKFPIVNKGEIDFNANTNSCLWADMIISGDTIRVYSVHFESNQISKPTEELMDDIEKDKGIQSKSIRKILAKYKTFVQLRAGQVEKVRNHIEKSPYKVLIGGDFNDPPVSYTYNRFASILKDAFRERGWGLGISYSGIIPLLRIDYLLVSPDIPVVEFETVRSKYSDHYPVKAKFIIDGASLKR